MGMKKMISRRYFLTGIGVGMLGLGRAREDRARFELGIGTHTYHGVTEEQMIENLKTLQIRQIELSSPNYFLPAVKLDAVQRLHDLDQLPQRSEPVSLLTATRAIEETKSF
jgi:hypothetical protein